MPLVIKKKASSLNSAAVTSSSPPVASSDSTPPPVVASSSTPSHAKVQLASGPAVATARKSVKRERERKTERMDIRVTPTVREFVEHIMDASGYTAGDLLLEGARALLRDLEARPRIDRPDYAELRIRRRRP